MLQKYSKCGDIFNTRLNFYCDNNWEKESEEREVEAGSDAQDKAIVSTNLPSQAVFVIQVSEWFYQNGK